LPGIQQIRFQVTAAAANHQDAALENAKPFKDVPKIPMLDLMKKMDEMRKAGKPRYYKLFKEYMADENITRFWFPGMGWQVFITEPQDVQTMLANEGKHPVEPGFDFFVNYRHYKKNMFPGSTGLLGSHGDEWYHARSLVQQDMMRPKSALYYVDDISEITNQFLDLMQKNRDVPDVVPFIYRWALESVGAIFLDSRIGCLNEPPAMEAQAMIECVDVCLGDPLIELITKPPFIWKYIWKGVDFKKFDAASERMFEITSGIIKKAQLKNKDKVYENKDNMNVLAKLTEKCGPDSTIPQVMAMDALFAGIDTTGNTSAFMLYLLGINPEKQELVHKEIVEKLPPSKKLTASILNELKYPKAVMQETLRMLPVVGGFGRLTETDMVLAGYQIPAGTKVSATIVDPMRSEKHFQNADQFIPERWMRGCPAAEAGKKSHPFACIPFSHGPRMCVGRRFAELELQVLIIETLRRYKVKYDGPVIDLITPFINRPDGPIKVTFEERK